MSAEIGPQLMKLSADLASGVPDLDGIERALRDVSLGGAKSHGGGLRPSAIFIFSHRASEYAWAALIKQPEEDCNGTSTLPLGTSPGSGNWAHDNHRPLR